MAAQKLIISLADNESLAEALSSKGPGDTVELEVTVKVDEIAGDTARFSVVDASVIVEDEAAEEPELEEGDSLGKPSSDSDAIMPGVDE